VFFCFRVSPISHAAFSIYWRSMLPSGLLGVPTATKVMSVFSIAFSQLEAHLSLPVLTAFSSGSCKFGS